MVTLNETVRDLFEDRDCLPAHKWEEEFVNLIKFWTQIPEFQILPIEIYGVIQSEGLEMTLEEFQAYNKVWVN